MHCGGEKISWKKFAVAVELFVEVETATHRLSEVMKKDPKFYHVPGWFEYVSALGASLLVEATGKLFRDYKPNGPVDGEVDIRSNSGSESDSDNSSDSGIDSDTESNSEMSSESDFNPDAAAQSKVPDPTPVQPLLSLEYLVSSLSIFEATVPHDTIYAMLAIAKDTTPSAGGGSQLLLDHTKDILEVFTEKKRYKVEYGQPFVDVCKDFVQFCIEHSDQSRALDIICRPWAPEAQDPAKQNTVTRKKIRGIMSASAGKSRHRLIREASDITSDFSEIHLPKKKGLKRKAKDDMPLPSWIPKLSGAAYAMYSQAGIHELKMGRKNADTLVGLPPSNQSLMRNYNAAQTKIVDVKALKFRRRPKMGHYSMYVKGFILDVVDEVQPSSQGGAIPREWARAAGWRNAPESDPPDEFWRTLVADRGRDGRNPPVYYSRACKESFFKGGLSSGRVDTTDLINNERCSIVAQFCRRVQSVIWNRALIKVTHTERLGLANQTVSSGDLVCIMYGCSVPVILRQKQKSEDGEIDAEVDEEVHYYQHAIATRLTMNFRRLKSFHLKRLAEKEKYNDWDKNMYNQWQKDDPWQNDWQQKQIRKVAGEEKTMDEMEKALEKGLQYCKKPRQNGHGVREVEMANVVNGRIPLNPGGNSNVTNKSKDDYAASKSPTDSVLPSSSPKDKSQTVAFAIDNDTSWCAARMPAPHGLAVEPVASGARESAVSSPRAVSSLPSTTQVTVSPPDREGTSEASGDTKEGQVRKRMKVRPESLGEFLMRRKRVGRERVKWLAEEEIQWPERKEFVEWKKAKREEIKRETKEWEKIQAEVVETSKAEQVPPRKWDEPRVNWTEFEIFLKYGRQWKRIVWMKKQLPRWYGEYLLYWRATSEYSKTKGKIQEKIERVKRKQTLNRPDVSRPKGKRRTLREGRKIFHGDPKANGMVVDPQHSGPSGKKKEVAANDYLERLRAKIREKYVFQKEQTSSNGSQENEGEHLQAGEDDDDESNEEQKKIREHNRRVSDNRCYYEFLGECYIHGMMDGEAMAYQNDNSIRPQMFELR